MRPTLHRAHVKFGIALEAQNKFAEVEAHYMAAERPREDREMCSHNEMWQDARRVAATYSIGGIPLAPAKGTGSPGETEGLTALEKAMHHEQKWQPDDAITPYLALVKLPANFVPARLRDVVTTIAQLLISMNNDASLGKILENIEVYLDAFEIENSRRPENTEDLFEN
jgi:hypothetical protein